jgi:ectoine hydroxylase-related dioxygenase (phytanoyl-CoA dioxygenase family)
VTSPPPLQTHPELQDEVVAWTTELLQQQSDQYNVVDPVIISNGKTEAQPAHCDIKDQSHLWREDPPLSGITALEDNTLLLVMRDLLEGYKNQLEMVALNAGDVLIFHALLVHAGGDYSRTNRRIHFTALSRNGMSRPINETYVV